MGEQLDNISVDSSDSDSRPNTRSSLRIDQQSIRENGSDTMLVGTLKKLNLTSNKFMENFNPETSARERRKLNRKLNTTGGRKHSSVLFDEHGIHIISGQDICDCLLADCPGCFFQCPKCSSTKCGTDCRANRKYMYENVEFEGCNINVKNTYGK